MINFIYFNFISSFNQYLFLNMPEFYLGCLLLLFLLWILWLKFLGNISRKSIIKKFILILILYLISIFLLNDFYIAKSSLSSFFLIDYYSIVFKVCIVLSTVLILIFTMNRNNNTYLTSCVAFTKPMKALGCGTVAFTFYKSCGSFARG